MATNPSLRGSVVQGGATTGEPPTGVTVIHTAGFATCGYYKRASQVVASLSILFPDRFKHEDTEFPTRDDFKAWLPTVREGLGAKAEAHTSSPFVTINGKYLGGCDDTLTWARNLMASAAQDGGRNGETAMEQAPLHVDPFNPDHGFTYDLVVIGGGSGGLACAKEAAGLGARVALLDFVKPSPQGTSWGLGGTCVNVGCIPKKLMHQAALLGESVGDMPSFGWDVEKKSFSWETLKENVQNHIRSLNFNYRVTLRDKNVTYLNKLGKFLGSHELECVDKKGKSSVITSARFVIAVGGRPQAIECPGGEHAITSDDLFSLSKPPGKTCVVGAGYVSLECGGFLTALGYEVTVLVRSILLRGFDRECTKMIGEYMEAHGTKIIMETLPTAIEKQPDGKLLVHFSTGGSDLFDTVISARGRYADTAGLDLQKAGLEVNPSNQKFKCQSEQTNVPHIYAIGDVVDGKPELTPVAIQAGQLLARRLFGGSSEEMDYRNVATTIFTPLEYGCVGYSEDAAIETFGEDSLEIYHSTFSPLEWTLPPERAHHNAFAKVVVMKETDRVLGMHYLGPNAGEVIQGFGACVKIGITFKQLKDTVGIHPTVAEEFTTLTVTKSSGASAKKGGC